MPDVIFEDAPEVEEIAHRLIGEHHGHLINAKIKYLKRFGAWTVNGKERLGSAEKCTAKHKHLTGLDFIITVNGIIFENMTPPSVKRLLITNSATAARVTTDFVSGRTMLRTFRQWCAGTGSGRRMCRSLPGPVLRRLDS